MVEDFGILLARMMENAGLQLARLAGLLAGDNPVPWSAGGGNNGGGVLRRRGVSVGETDSSTSIPPGPYPMSASMITREACVRGSVPSMS